MFAGGGIRCFWHGGFMAAAARPLDFRPRRICGVSGGALSAAAFLGDVEERLLDTMADAFGRTDRNVSWHDLDGTHGLTPHQRIYREVVDAVLASPAQEKIAAGPAFQVFVSLPSPRAPRLHAMLAGGGYEVEKAILKRPRTALARALGMRGLRIDARQAAREGRLHDLVAAAATIPPVFRIPEWDGRPVTDGGMLDQAPRPDPDGGRTLFLMTRGYARLPESGPREAYVVPSAHPAGNKIDFTDPGTLRNAWELGERDGRAWLSARTDDRSER